MISKVSGICAIAFLSMAGLGAYLTTIALDLYKSRQDFYISELVNAQASIIERELERSLSATRILAQEVKQQRGMFTDFDTFAAEIINSLGGISNLQLAPNGIIERIFPLKGNEKAIGHDILKDDIRKDEAQMAVNQRLLTLTGPFKLIQGGVAVVGRNPIFLPSDNGPRSFWGFASALIFLDDLLETTELVALEGKGYCYQLSRKNLGTSSDNVFARSECELGENSVTVPIRVPNAVWSLNMSSPTTMPMSIFYVGYGLSFLVSALLAMSLRRVMLQPEILKQVVQRQTQELEFLSLHDQLTGLPNRRALSDQVERIIEEYERYRASAALVVIDLNDFKSVNDLCGHSMGNEVLRRVAKRLDRAVRVSDVVARLGGDEFAVLLQRATSVREINRAVEKITGAIATPLTVNGQELKLSASIGIVMIPQDGADFTSACHRAEMAMYSSKHGGKDHFSFFNESLQTEAIERIKLLNSLQRAVSSHAFMLHLQPIVELPAERTVGYEALIRWQHSDKGLLYPASFIQLAEETDCIYQIGHWVIEEVCRLIRDYPISGWVSINLSPKQFDDPELIDKLSKITKAHQVRPAQIEIEITESAIIDNVEQAIHTLNQLKKLGFSIALDDFGTGYCSLSLLKTLPVDKIKLDKSFVDEISADNRCNDIVQGLTMMAHRLGLVVVAEGIETVEQNRCIKCLGCDYGQGYFFSKPQPAKTLLIKANGVDNCSSSVV